MKFRFCPAIAALSGLAAGASAQVITTPGITATLSLNWMEDPAFLHNDDGDLDIGEHALIIMTISFTGQNNRVNFSPAVGGFTSGTILGLSSAYIDIRGIGGDASGLYNGGITVPPSTSVGPNNNSAGTSGYGVRGGWRLGGNVANGTPVSNGFQTLGPGQLPLSPEGADTTNPIMGAERLGWAPNSYAYRLQTFRVVDALGGSSGEVALYLDLDGGATGASAYLPVSAIAFGSVVIPFDIPGPGGLALMGLGGLCTTRRRRA